MRCTNCGNQAGEILLAPDATNHCINKHVKQNMLTINVTNLMSKLGLKEILTGCGSKR